MMEDIERPLGDWRRTVYGRSRISGIGIRRSPRTAERNRVLEIQGNRCLYCELPIGTAIWRHSRSVTLQANWDHFVPFAYLAQNPESNWVLACHVCNNIKSCRMFDTVQAARDVILPAREVKGYEDLKSVLLRLGLVATDNPWPEEIRPSGYAHYHSARLIRAGVYLTACGAEIQKDAIRAIRPHQRRCSKCSIRRDIPVVPPGLEGQADSA